ncbi:hypothetical protein M752DRAFT_261716 [Aspergillus phoenicis ATCC 13157]|uniref:Uncharacterized protein n=2 Tax=Aspergillus TaxID=5052 RepID=A0A370PX23_ASPPH|nr:hypothetical protein M747DRAFT_356892 [Aspergillus niger ATCC 13496]RDK46746.1 hypothetical protein M752DRAFT_261716 [Aspergillus phoenicis ATCC 13157]
MKQKLEDGKQTVNPPPTKPTLSRRVRSRQRQPYPMQIFLVCVYTAETRMPCNCTRKVDMYDSSLCPLPPHVGGRQNTTTMQNTFHYEYSIYLLNSNALALAASCCTCPGTDTIFDTYPMGSGSGLIRLYTRHAGFGVQLVTLSYVMYLVNLSAASVSSKYGLPVSVCWVYNYSWANSYETTHQSPELKSTGEGKKPARGRQTDRPTMNA